MIGSVHAQFHAAEINALDSQFSNYMMEHYGLLDISVKLLYSFFNNFFMIFLGEGRFYVFL